MMIAAIRTKRKRPVRPVADKTLNNINKQLQEDVVVLTAKGIQRRSPMNTAAMSRCMTTIHDQYKSKVSAFQTRGGRGSHRPRQLLFFFIAPLIHGGSFEAF